MRNKSLLLVGFLLFAGCGEPQPTTPQPLPSEQELLVKKCREKKQLQKNLQNVNRALNNLSGLMDIDTIDELNEFSNFAHEVGRIFQFEAPEDECDGVDLDAYPQLDETE